MHLTVTTLSDQIFTLEVSEDLELENLKAMCEMEANIPAREIVLVWNGRPLHDDKRTMRDYGIKNGDMLLLQHMRSHPTQPAQGSSPHGVPEIDFGNIQVPGVGLQSPAMAQGPTGATGGPTPGPSQANIEDDPANVREILLNNPRELSLLKERNPPLAEALLGGNLETFTKVFQQQLKERKERERERIRLMNADPFDPEVQGVIAEEIRMKNVESNMENAIEFSPESFGQVVMLYIDCKVNGHHVKAFVDSGAQMTIMSQACAERCNIMRLVDPRWAGIAKGVGTQKIIGRVHLGQIQIEKDFLPSSFSILESQPMDMLLGLDMLKRHQCCIDLKNNRLIIGTTGTETRFLAESELPEQARLNLKEPLSPRASQELEDKDIAEAMSRSQQDRGPKPGTSQGTSNRPSFPEETVRKLMSHGFSRDEVIAELTAKNGDENNALVSLFAKSFPAPPR